jgi:hypothetical protein
LADCAFADLQCPQLVEADIDATESVFLPDRTKLNEQPMQGAHSGLIRPVIPI